MTNEAGIQIDLIGTLKRRAYVASVIAGVITLFVYWVAMALPNEYTASAVLLVEPQTVNGKLIEPGASGIDLNERLNLMTAQILSRTRLSKIIEELQLFEKESKSMTRQEIVDEMRSKISVRPVIPELTRGLRARDKPIEINTFEVFFSASSAVTAAQVAQTLANDFIQSHIAARVESTQASLEFIAAEESRLSTRIREIDSVLAEIKEENESSLPENLAATQRTMERDLSEMRYAQRQLDVARSDLSFWEHQFRTAQALGQSLNGQDSLSPARRIQGLELQLKELVARGFTERHPDMISLKAELASNRRGVSEARAAKEENEDLVPQSFGEQNADAERQRSKLHVASLEQEVERISLHLDQLRAHVVATPRVAEKMEAFERQRVQLASSLEGFSSLRLQAAVQADLERRQLGERFRILESAIPPLEISSPNRGLILILGLLFGLTIGVVVGLVAEGTDPSFHQERDLQSSIGIPVLAVIPSISFDEDLDRQRRSRSMRAMAMVGVTAFSLFGGFGTYVFVNGAPSWLSGLIDIGSGDDGEAEGEAEAFRHQVMDPIA